MREFDKSLEERKGEDQYNIDIREESKEDSQYYICCIDESEYLSIFSHKTTENGGKGAFQQKIRSCKETPAEIKDKDIFGMGYPYFVALYGRYVACSSDYGVCFLQITDESVF